jgi:hypothetical protein
VLPASSFPTAFLPANEGRGYVLRRIMRRAMRHAHLLGAKEPLMHRLVPALVAEMGVAYPELIRAQPLIEATLQQEETRFRQTLANGLKLLDEATADMARAARCPARPPSSSTTLTASLRPDRGRAARRGLDVDRAASTRHGRAKGAARAAWKGSGDKAATNSGSTSPRRSARPNSPAIPARRRGRGPRHRQGRRRVDSAESARRSIVSSTRRLLRRERRQIGDAGKLILSKASSVKLRNIEASWQASRARDEGARARSRRRNVHQRSTPNAATAPRQP